MKHLEVFRPDEKYFTNPEKIKRLGKANELFNDQLEAWMISIEYCEALIAINKEHINLLLNW